MHVVVYSPGYKGHYFMYVRRVIPALATLASRITFVTSPEGAESDEFRVQVAPLASMFTLRVLKTWPRGVGMEFARTSIASLGEAITTTRPEALIVTTGDGLAQLTGWLRPLGLSPLGGGYHSECALHRGSFAYPTAGRAIPPSVILGGLRLSRWTRVHFVDHLAYEHVRRAGGSLAARASLLPDPVEIPPFQDRREARRRLGLPEDGRVVCCAGMIDARKGVDGLIRAFARARLERSDRLLLVGRASEEVRAMLSGEFASLTRDGRAFLIDRFVNEQEFDTALQSADVVAAVHPAHVGLSNLALRSVAAGRPLLGSTFGWLGAMVPRLGIGVTVNVGDESAFASALERVLVTAPTYTPPEAARRLMEFHSPKNFEATWLDGLRARMGLPPLERTASWDWVLQAADQPLRT